VRNIGLGVGERLERYRVALASKEEGGGAYEQVKGYATLPRDVSRRGGECSGEWRTKDTLLA